MQRCDNIIATEGQGCAHAHGLVANLREKSADDLALFVEEGSPVVQSAGKPHPVVGLT